MIYTEQHRELMRSVTKFVEAEINPHAEEWEAAGIFPAHELFKKMGDQGLLGIHKPEKFGGQGLDYSYEVAFCEALGAAKSASAVMAIGVQTDMATPALTKNGSDELREEFLKPSITGDYVATMLAKFSARQPPDVFYIDSNVFLDWVTQGLLEPLDSYAKASHFSSKPFYEPLLNGFKYKGKIYGYPKDWSPLAMEVNTSLAAKAGVIPSKIKTWAIS